MTLQVLNTTDAGVQKFKCLIYGQNGTGKTMSALSLDREKTLIITCEPQTLNRLRNHSFKVLFFDEWGDLKEIREKISDTKCIEKYDTLFIDSLSQINEKAKEWIVKRDRPSVKGKVANIYEDLLTQGDYQVLETRIKRLVMGFVDMPYNVIFTARETETKDETTGKIFYKPELNGKLAMSIAAYFPEVYRLIAGPGEDNAFTNHFITKKTDNAIAKGDPILETFETGNDGRVNFKEIMRKIFSNTNTKRNAESAPPEQNKESGEEKEEKAA